MFANSPSKNRLIFSGASRKRKEGDTDLCLISAPDFLFCAISAIAPYDPHAVFCAGDQGGCLLDTGGGCCGSAVRVAGAGGARWRVMWVLGVCLSLSWLGAQYGRIERLGGVVGGELLGGAGGLGAGVVVGARVAGYRLEEQIGRGGMSVVFRARDERLGRLVALKIMAPGLAADEAFRRRFIRESRAAAAVDDPHIIPIYQAGAADGLLYIAMRYVAGGDMRSLLRHQGPLPPARAVVIVSAVASALDAAHAAGLVHRDVNPANMLLDARADRPDHVYLSDFGLSKSWQGSAGATDSGIFLGALNYSSPEQLQGHPVDGRTDQYALACSAFELLTGEPPFRRDPSLAVVNAQVSTPPPLLSQWLPELDPAVDEVFARALATTAGERYDSCEEFAHALGGALGLAPDGHHGPGLHPPGSVPTVAAAELARRPRPSGSGETTAGSTGSSRAIGRNPPGAALRGDVSSFGAAESLSVAIPDRGRAPRRKTQPTLLVAAVALVVISITGIGIGLLVVRHKQPGSDIPSPSVSGTAARPTPSAKASPLHSAKASAPVWPPTKVMVCVIPASRCSGSASANGNGTGIGFMKMAPAHIVTSADGSQYLTGLTWSGWGNAKAHGKGTLKVDNCVPNCAGGEYAGYPATVTLSNLTPYGNGEQAYTTIVVAAPRAPYPVPTFKKGLLP